MDSNKAAPVLILEPKLTCCAILYLSVCCGKKAF